jgi:CheY-like chemotaxis protein
MDNGKKVLVIDDERLIVKTTCILLRHMGYGTLEAFDGASGLALAQRERPDLILLDLVMPGEDGWRILARLKEDPGTAGIPALIFTAKEYANAETLGSLRGAAGLITKPFEPEDLVEALGKLETKEARGNER